MQLDNDIFAYACNNVAVMERIVKEAVQSFEKPELDSCKVHIEASDFTVFDEKEKYIEILLENVGNEIISSRKKFRSMLHTIFWIICVGVFSPRMKRSMKISASGRFPRLGLAVK